MLHTFNRFAMIAALAVVGFVTAADAQNKPQPPENAIQQIARPGNSASLAGGIANRSPSPQWVIGWNYVHATNCDMYNSSGYTFLVVYPQEGGYFYTIYPLYQNVIEPACQTGNWLAFHVYDYSNDWDQVWTYPYK
jgi:uncharacterized membrane protein